VKVYHYKKIFRSYEVCCLYGFFIYHILSYCFGSIFYHCVCVCVYIYIYIYICFMLLFNFVNYVFLLLFLCIFIVMYVL